MAKSTRKYTESFKDLNLEDDYEDFGYEVQNQKRYSTRNKRQSKFKDYDEHVDWDWIIFGSRNAPFFIHFPLYIKSFLVGWHLDSSRGGTEELVGGSGGCIVRESSGIEPWTTTSTPASLATTSTVCSWWMKWLSLPTSVCLSPASCQNLTRCGMMRWRNPTFVTTYDTWHLQFFWRCYHLPWFGWCSFDRHYCFYCFHSLL